MKAKIVDGKIVEIEATPYEMAEYKKWLDTPNYKITHPNPYVSPYTNPYPWTSPTTVSPYTYRQHELTCNTNIKLIDSDSVSCKIPDGKYTMCN